jgi:hypothetical protein
VTVTSVRRPLRGGPAGAGAPAGLRVRPSVTVADAPRSLSGAAPASLGQKTSQAPPPTASAVTAPGQPGHESESP